MGQHKVVAAAALVVLFAIFWWRWFSLDSLLKSSIATWATAGESITKEIPSVAEHNEAEKNERKFVSYTSSTWEHMWLENVNDWTEKKRICQEILSSTQSNYLHDFLNLTCTSRLAEPYSSWCVIDDNVNLPGPLWYKCGDRSSVVISAKRPDEVPPEIAVPPPQPVIPTSDHEHIVSKFVFLNESSGAEYVEYIEPLVSHLRHPLAQCMEPNLLLHRSYIIPPPPSKQQQLKKRRSLYFDAGASSWNSGAGGPSLSYFTSIWKRHGILFDEIYAFEATVAPEKFYETVPENWKNKSHYQQAWISSEPENHTAATPFLPFVIRNKATKDDYVMFKLDIDSPLVEEGTINYLLQDDNDALDHINELFWEHHITSNYLLSSSWFGYTNVSLLPYVSQRESYAYFLKMRHRGVRAHSWV